MPYRLLVDVTVVVHLLFIGYVVVGGFLAWRWQRTIWLHLAAAAWAAGIVAIGFDCPLTYLEDWARARGGEPPLPPDGFIAHYLTGVVYPASAATLVQALVAAVVLTSWIGYVRLRRRDRMRV